MIKINKDIKIKAEITNNLFDNIDLGSPNPFIFDNFSVPKYKNPDINKAINAFPHFPKILWGFKNSYVSIK